MKVLRDLPRETKLGLGLVNPKTMEIESESVIMKRVEEAMKLFGADRVAALHPDCGFATLRTTRSPPWRLPGPSSKFWLALPSGFARILMGLVRL